MTDQDDDIEDYLDPELDPMPSESKSGFPPLFSVGGAVVGLFFLVTGAILPMAWFAVQEGAYMQAGFFSVLSALLIVAGLVSGRIAHQKTSD